MKSNSFLKKKIQKGVKDNHTSWLKPFVDGPTEQDPSVYSQDVLRTPFPH